MFDRRTMIDDVIAALETGWLPAKPQQAYFPLPAQQFLDGLARCVVHRPGGSFLEVGCGVGTKVVLAALGGFMATGIDIDPEYVQKASALIAAAGVGDRAGVAVGDAMAESYAGYDVIYCSCVFELPADQAALENRILDQAQPSAILFWPSSDRPAERGYKTFAYNLWLL